MGAGITQQQTDRTYLGEITMTDSMDIPVYRHEKNLFVLMVIFSAVFWLALILGTLGIALLFIPVVFIFYVFLQSAFISHIKGTAAKITPEQFPDLHARVTACAEKLRMKTVPDAYILHANGIFNALATRFLGRNFIILYSDVVDALADNPDAINFYIGHELAHIRQRHLVWGPLLGPGGILPLLGAGYSRARESTCDLQGAYCCENRDSARQGLAALAVGSRRWKSMNMESYKDQTRGTGGFWMSFHELIGDYPWLVKRVMRVDGKSGEIPSRNPLAWLLALFVPRMGFGAAYSVFVIAILAAVAVPAYQEYTARAQVAAAMPSVATAKACVIKTYQQSKTVPETNADCGLPAPDKMSNNKYVQSIAIDGGLVTMTMAATGVPKKIAGKTIVFEPRLDKSGRIFWLCSDGTLPAMYRPKECRK
jgi:Zn-dependent protease with chaperone function/Tfp pilus assembly protein PilE